jgi:hypothetical protein
MNARAWLGFVVVFVVMSVLEAVIHVGLLSADYQATANLWRPMGEMKIYIFHMAYFIVSFFFTLVFFKYYEGNGQMEGLRYGLCVGLMMAATMACIPYAATPIPHVLALKWFIFETMEYAVLGAVLALIFGGFAKKTKKFFNKQGQNRQEKQKRLTWMGRIFRMK